MIYRTCPHPDCTRLIPANATGCSEHDRAARNRTTGRNRYAWQHTRRRILERDGYTCTATRPKAGRCTAQATTVHRPAGGYHHDDDHYVSLCTRCHAIIERQRTEGIAHVPITYTTGPPHDTRNITTPQVTPPRGGGKTSRNVTLRAKTSPVSAKKSRRSVTSESETWGYVR